MCLKNGKEVSTAQTVDCIYRLDSGYKEHKYDN